MPHEAPSHVRPPLPPRRPTLSACVGCSCTLFCVCRVLFALSIAIQIMHPSASSHPFPTYTSGFLCLCASFRPCADRDKDAKERARVDPEKARHKKVAGAGAAGVWVYYAQPRGWSSMCTVFVSSAPLWCRYSDGGVRMAAPVPSPIFHGTAATLTCCRSNNPQSLPPLLDLCCCCCCLCNRRGRGGHGDSRPGG